MTEDETADAAEKLKAVTLVRDENKQTKPFEKSTREEMINHWESTQRCISPRIPGVQKNKLQQKNQENWSKM